MSSSDDNFDDIAEDQEFDIAEQANASTDSVPGIIDAPKPQAKTEYALKKSANTPWFVDLFAAVCLAGVVVFNAAGWNIWIRLAALAALIIALLFETRYSAGAQARSDKYLMMTLGGIVGGFIIIIVGSVIILEMFNDTYIAWILFVVISLLAFLVARGFRNATRAFVEKSQTDDKLVS